MTKHTQTKILSLVICIMLIAAMAFTVTSCNKSQGDKVGTEFSFTFEIIEGKGEYTETKDNTFLVKTNEKTVGDALYALGLIDGDEGDYGLYIKTTNGIFADYDVNGHYWALYIDGAYAMSGADTTEIVEGSVYRLSYEK